jgi:hypothetical protein
VLVLDLDWVSGASSHPCRIVNFVGGEVQQGCAVRLIGGDNIRIAKEDAAQDWLLDTQYTVPWEVWSLNKWRKKTDGK